MASQQQQLAMAYRAQQAALAATVTKQTLGLWTQLFRPDDAAVWRALLGLLRTLVGSRRDASSRLAVVYYGRARQDAGVATPFMPQLAAPAPAGLVDATAGITGPGAFRRSLRAGHTADRARRNAGVQLAGAMQNLVADAGRDTIRDSVADDLDAIGWVRITDAKPCAFCALLAGRGPVYQTRQTAAFQAHAHCRCVAAPVFSRDEAWLGHSKDLAEQWQQVTAGHSGKDAINVWRRHWEGQRAGEPDAAGAGGR